MNSLVLSGYFVLSVILFALWVVTKANRAPPPPASLAKVSDAGRDFSRFARAWKRRLHRTADRAGAR
jgi:hypothetical protein